jgi:hypothetical protein
MGTGLSRPAFLAGVAWAAADWSSWATAQPTPAAHEPQLHSAVDAAAAAAPATTVTTLGALAADPQAARLCLGGGVCLDRVELSTCGGRWCAELTPAAFGSTRVYTAQAHHGMTSDWSGPIHVPRCPSGHSFIARLPALSAIQRMRYGTDYVLACRAEDNSSPARSIHSSLHEELVHGGVLGAYPAKSKSGCAKQPVRKDATAATLRPSTACCSAPVQGEGEGQV